ncbi:PREDICTED: uncharacterized protein LOC104591583 isoform X2 [Nelumbo nucifera]|nr:PREDICTED: uncharacterized protein LOC104591583 isoform X2 [Nelumbo nucifera]
MEADKLKGDRLFKHMKGRKKRAAKRARIESPPAPTPEPQLPQAPISEPELPGAPPISEPGASAETVVRSATEAKVATGAANVAAEVSAKPIHTAETAVSSLGSPDGVQSILLPQCGLRKSKGATYSEEIAVWADMLNPSHLGARAATHTMVANSVVHALTLQTERYLKQALIAEESSRVAHTELRMAREQIHRLDSGAMAQRGVITALTEEKDGLARENSELRGKMEALRAEQTREKGVLRGELDALKVEAEGLKEKEKVLLHEVEFLKADIAEKTKIFTQAIEETKVKAVSEYIQSDKFDAILGEAYRKGFKLNRWLIRHTYPELDTSAITTSRITSEIARQAAEDPDSEEKGGDEEADTPDQPEAPGGGEPPK